MTNQKFYIDIYRKRPAGSTLEIKVVIFEKLIEILLN